MPANIDVLEIQFMLAKFVWILFRGTWNGYTLLKDLSELFDGYQDPGGLIPNESLGIQSLCIISGRKI